MWCVPAILVQTIITPWGANLISRRLIVCHGACKFPFFLILTISQHDAFADMRSSHRSLFTSCLISISNVEENNWNNWNCNSCKRNNPQRNSNFENAICFYSGYPQPELFIQQSSFYPTRKQTRHEFSWLIPHAKNEMRDLGLAVKKCNKIYFFAQQKERTRYFRERMPR